MNFRIKKRLVLVLLIVACQAACLFGAIAVFSAKMRSSIRQTIHDQVLADNIQTAGQMTALIRQMGVSDIRENVGSWERLQSSIRELKLPNEGFVCLTDSVDGSLLCHPALENHPTLPDAEMKKPAMAKPAMVKPEMAKTAMVKPKMTKPAMTKPAMSKPAMTKPQMTKAKPSMVKPAMVKPEMVKSHGETTTNGQATNEPIQVGKVTGMVTEHYGELQIIAAAHLPELNATVNVHQKASGIEENISQIMSPVLPLGLAISLGSLFFTSGLVFTVMRRYDNRLLTMNESLEDKIQQRTKTLRRTRDAVIYGLAKLAESRDTDTGEHLDRIRLYVTILAAKIGRFNRRHIETLALASSLHDIGKVGIPDRVLLKPGGFTPEERQVMEQHSALGGECLKAIGDKLGEDDFLQLAREIAFCHHEKWDGTGYPLKIRGEAIPISARIVALADVYDALRSRRPYKEPIPHEKAKAIILEDSGTHFDPKIVKAFLQCEEQFIEVSERFNCVPLKASDEERVLLPN